MPIAISEITATLGSAGSGVLRKIRTDAVALLAAFLMIGGTASLSLAMEKRCAKAAGVTGLTKHVPDLSAKIQAGEAIRIVALGSSSTEGTGHLPKSDIYAAVLERELSRELLVPVEIINKGRGGEDILKMVARIERDVIAFKPFLLVWQLGVNDVLQMDGVEGVLPAMKTALEAFRKQGLPVVLLDLQAAPMVDRDKDTPVMQAAIEEAAKRPGVMQFHRLAFMRRMIETREAEMGDLVLGDGLHMSKLGHYCTGKLLAQQIARSGLEVTVSSAR